MQTITDIAVGDSNFSILVSALQYVDTQLPGSNLVTTLADETGSFTVFAPTNAAFGQLASGLGFEGDPANADAVTGFIVGALPAETIRDVLLYHVAAGSLDAAAIASAGTVNPLGGGSIAFDNPTLVDAEPDLIDPSLIATDISADNGTIHVIDRVLLPSDLAGNDAPSIVEIVAASGEAGSFDDNGGDFDILHAAVDAAGLGTALADTNADLTVFAPNDDAFLSLAQTLGNEAMDEAGATDVILRALSLFSGGSDPLPLLSQVLLYHVAGESLQASQVLSSDMITTLQSGILSVDGASLGDADPDLQDPNIIATDIQANNGVVHVIDGVLIPADLLGSDGSNDVDLVFGGDEDNALNLGEDNDLADLGNGNNTLLAGAGNDVGVTGDGDDLLLGREGMDTLRSGDGSDTIAGGDEDDMIYAGATDADVRDVIYAGSGNDFVDAGAGNDLVYGEAGHDTLNGGAGSDQLVGQAGNDFLSGGALSDAIFGGAGEDFIHGAWGYDRLNGGDGADRFYHTAHADHATDWIQDFSHAEGDYLQFQLSGVTADDFVLHFNDAVSMSGQTAGDDTVQEAFVDYNGHILFALVDGAGNDSIMVRTMDGMFDLMA
ncbi:Hemolysin, chromosomal [Shimia thalassica]|uniref:Hemolysin, chromosomal n=1 Tax=Shimia thalassica TaxID=1715693 RepID=A0A0P1I469_9RHOB|nr:fasciclin domain-containing protein [Shimia thalassica]CUJ89167.1 Hemolysin, chromosomal [Shimia thalassica]